MSKRIWTAIGAAVLTTGLIAGCGAQTVSSSSTSHSTVTTKTSCKKDRKTGKRKCKTTKHTSRPVAKHHDAKVGDTLHLQGAENATDVTLLAVKDPAPYEATYFPTDAGHRLVAVKLRITNTSQNPYSDSPSNGMKVSDEDDQWYDADIMVETTAGPNLGSPKLKKGASAVGWVAFQLPNKAELDNLQFTMDSGFANQTGEWDLT